MTTNQDINTFEDVKSLVDTFYQNVRNNSTLGPIFESYLAGHWNEHLEKLYRFWQTVLLREPAYYGKPVPVHFKMEIGEAHFTIWLNIWNNTVDNLFAGSNADRAKLRGRTMSEAFLKKIKNHN